MKKTRRNINTALYLIGYANNHFMNNYDLQLQELDGATVTLTPEQLSNTKLTIAPSVQSFKYFRYDPNDNQLYGMTEKELIDHAIELKQSQMKKVAEGIK